MRKSIGWAVAAIAAVATINNADAYSGSISITVVSGQKTLVVNLFNCTTNVAPYIEVDTPMHGMATIVRTTGNFCNRAQESVAEVFYQSNPGFKGMDAVTIYDQNGQIASYQVVTVK